MSKVSNIASKASKPSAGASWQRPAIGRPTSASIDNNDKGIVAGAGKGVLRTVYCK